MSIHTVLLRKTLAMLFLLTMTGTGCLNAAEPLEIKKLVKRYLVNHKGVKFVIKTKIEYPIYDTRIQRVISEKLFGEGSDNIEVAVDKFLQQFEKVESYSMDKSAKYKDGIHEIHIEYHGRKDMYSEQFGDTATVTNYCQTANEYASFICFAEYKFNQNEDKKLTDSNINLCRIYEYFTYDTKTGRLLTMGDVLSQELLAKNGLNASSTNLLVEPYAQVLSIIIDKDGKMQNANFTTSKKLNIFTDRINILTDSINKQNEIVDRQLDVINNKRGVELAKTVKLQNYLNRLDYQSYITNMEDLYLYMWSDTCYVSGINKDINQLTEEEINRLAANKGCGYIAKDIRYAKKLLNGRKVLPYGTVWMTDVYPKDKCDKAPVPPKDPKEVIKKGTTGSHFAAESCKVIYIIDENGDLQMPIVTSTCIPTYDQYIISRIRTLTKWTPGMVQGKNVSVMVRDSFSVDGAIK